MISHVMTLANGIIGVSVLAMPFCFKQCGIVLATLILLLSSLLSRLACHFLIKSAVMSRRRNFEFLAFHAFGPMGKFLAELCIIGFLLGTCIAFFVVVGDLGPQIIGEMIDKTPDSIRTSLLITTGIFIVLPLGLLKNIDSLASVSTASIAFYICLTLKVVAESTHHIFAADWFDKVHYWRVGGMLQCLPIFALALFCQTQLFEIYETMPNASLEKMNEVVQKALNICTIVYISVGVFGNIAFCNQPFTGNILMSFEPGMSSEVIKIGFVLSVAFSFPLVIFPCRASLNSLLFRRGYAHEISSGYITEARFRCLTTFIVITSLIVGVLIPNIEFVLGIVGSTIGVIICLIFPAAFFISISTKNTNERLVAQLIVIVGVWIMVLGTYANLYAMEKSSNIRAPKGIQFPNQIDPIPNDLINDISIKGNSMKKPDTSGIIKDAYEEPKPKVPDKIVADNNIRKEPPVPVELLEPEKLKDSLKNNPADTVKNKGFNQQQQNVEDNKLIQETQNAYDSLKKIKQTNDQLPLEAEANLLPKENEKIDSGPKNNDVIAVDAIKKEESELAADKELSNVDSMQRREQLDKTLEKHIMQEKDLMEEQKQLLKDIEQKKKEIELAKKMEKDQEKTKKVESSDNKVSSGSAKNVQQPIKDMIEPIIDNQPFENKDKNPQLISSAKSPVIKNLSNSLSDNKNNILPNLNSKVDKIDEQKDLKEKEFRENQVIDSLAKKPKNSIMSVLTKKSIISPPENETGVMVKIVGKYINAGNETSMKKLKEKSVPSVMKIKNETNLSDSESKSNHAGMKRTILEQHQRQKREENDVLYFAKSENKENNENNFKINESIIKEKVCSKTSKGQFVDKNKDKIQTEKSQELENESSNNLIKESIHLLGQNIIDKVTPVTILPHGNNFLNLKNRDLKSLNFNDKNKKK